MAKKRVILELGTGNDLHGSDYTKAALRAVQDALHPAVLALVKATAEAGARSHVPVAVCGEAAGDPLAAVVLVGAFVVSLV